MRAFAAKGDHPEALNAFRRCRELLSIVLGAKPSGETERLHWEIWSVAGREAPSILISRKRTDRIAQLQILQQRQPRHHLDRGALAPAGAAARRTACHGGVCR